MAILHSGQYDGAEAKLVLAKGKDGNLEFQFHIDTDVYTVGIDENEAFAIALTIIGFYKEKTAHLN